MMNNRDLSAPQESASLAAGDRARRLPSPQLLLRTYHDMKSEMPASVVFSIVVRPGT